MVAGALLSASDCAAATRRCWATVAAACTIRALAGAWPQSGGDDDSGTDDDDDLPPRAAAHLSVRGGRRVYRARKSVFQRPNGYLPMKYDVNAPRPPVGSYEAQISKTEDGGATWKAAVWSHTRVAVVPVSRRRVG